MLIIISGVYFGLFLCQAGPPGIATLIPSALFDRAGSGISCAHRGADKCNAWRMTCLGNCTQVPFLRGRVVYTAHE